MLALLLFFGTILSLLVTILVSLCFVLFMTSSTLCHIFINFFHKYHSILQYTKNFLKFPNEMENLLRGGGGELVSF